MYVACLHGSCCMPVACLLHVCCMWPDACMLHVPSCCTVHGASILHVACMLQHIIYMLRVAYMTRTACLLHITNMLNVGCLLMLLVCLYAADMFHVGMLHACLSNVACCMRVACCMLYAYYCLYPADTGARILSRCSYAPRQPTSGPTPTRTYKVSHSLMPGYPCLTLLRLYTPF